MRVLFMRVLGMILSAYTALFSGLAWLGIPLWVLTAIWWLCGVPVILQIVDWNKQYGYGRSSQ